MNDKELLEKKYNKCKRTEAVSSSVFLLWMLLLGGYVSKLPKEYAILAFLGLAVCFLVMVWASVSCVKIKKKLKFFGSTMEDDR